METLVSFLFTVLLTFFFVRRYLKRLAPGGAKSPETSAANPALSIACPRCAKSLPAGSSFCSHCGAALAMWKVQQAEVREAPVQSTANQLRPVINTSVCIGCGNCAQACDIQGTLQVVNGKSMLAHPERCQGHALCADACPTGALSLASGNALQTIRVPNMNPNFETNIAGLYIAGELGGTGLIRNAINQGKMAVDDMVRRLNGNRTVEGDDLLDLVIVGSGPAGLSASLCAHQHQLRYVTLEQGEVASTIQHYPRHKLVMAEPIDVPLYGSLYIGDGSKEALLAVWEAIIKSTGLCIRTHERVESVLKQEELFLVQTSKQHYRARLVLLAMGKQGAPRKLGVPGEESSKVLYRLIEAEGYSDNDILVVGGGDSALEAAVALSKINDNRVTISYRGDSFKRARERNLEKLEAQKADGKVNVLLGSEVAAIEQQSVRLRHSGDELEMPNHFVFAMIGGESPEEFLRRSGVEIVEKVVGAA